MQSHKKTNHSGKIKFINMKSVLRYSIILLTVCITGFVHAQNIWIANSNPGATGGTRVYTGSGALASAVGAAASGDIIYAVPSSIKYDDITIAKSGLSIYGIGTNPNKEGAKRSYINYIYISDGATAGTISSTIISGMEIEDAIEIGQNSNDIVDGLLIENCYLGYVQLNSGVGSNINISSNIFAIVTSYIKIDFNPNSTSNVVINNNIFIVNNYASYGAISGNNGIIVSNNLFVGESTNTEFGFYNFDGGTVKNNIFYGVTPKGGSGSFTNNSFVNNLSYLANDNVFSTTNGNTTIGQMEGVDPKLVNVPQSNSWDFSYDAHLQAGSTAINAGDDGKDLSITGGNVPFNFQGTNLPLVQSVNIPGVIIQGNNLPANVKAKGN